MEYKKALKPLAEAKKFVYDQSMLDFLKGREKFMRYKMSEKKKKQRKKKGDQISLLIF